MCNKEVLNELLRRFTTEEVILFCHMESLKSDLLFKESKDPLSDLSYDRDWWKDTGTQLERELKNESI